MRFGIILLIYFSRSNIESFVVIIIINNFFTPFFHLKILFEQLFNFAIVISRSFFSGKENWPTGCANEDGDIYDEFQTVDINEESEGKPDRYCKEREISVDCYPCPPPSSFYRERILSADVSSRLFHGQLFDKRKRIKEDRDARKKRRLLLLVSSGMPTIPNKVH